MNFQAFLAQQQADFWRGKAAEAQHQSNFVAQSWHSHGAPVSAESQVGGVYGSTPKVGVAQAAGRNLGHFNALNQQPGQTAHVPAEVKAQHEAQQNAQRLQQIQNAQVQQAQFRSEIAGLVHGIKEAIGAIGNATQNAGAVVQRFPGGSTLSKMSPAQASRITEGLDPGPNQAQAQALKAQSRAGLPISPETGEPSSLTALCRASVGL